MMPPVDKISDEVRNRLNVWRFLFKEMYESLLAAEELWEMTTEENADQKYFRLDVLVGKNRSYHFCLTARRAIFTQLLTFFGNIFGSSGYAGVGFSKNTDEKCELFKSGMEQFATEELQRLGIDYLAFKEKLMCLRNERVAHFDGDKAGYTVKDNGWVTAHKLPGVSFTQDEFLEVKLVIRVLYEYIERYFTAP